MQENERKYAKLTKFNSKDTSGPTTVKDTTVSSYQAPYQGKKNEGNGLEKLLRKETVRCDYCGGPVILVGRGRYTCEKCKKDTYDDFGKVYLYLDTHGPATKYEIAAATGVPERKVGQYLRERRLEIADRNGGLQ